MELLAGHKKRVAAVPLSTLPERTRPLRTRYGSGVAEPCFPEPAAADDRPGLRRESLADFLARSTWSRAVETRAFYNENLAALPSECRDRLCKRLKSEDTQAPTFELVVGRFLQLRGAQRLECEPETGGRRIDWQAEFPDGQLSVEAMAPLYNAGAGTEMRRQARLLDELERHVPEGWWLLPVDLPPIPENAPLGPYRSLLAALVTRLPDRSTLAPGGQIELVGELPEGEVRIAGFGATGRGGVGSGGMVAYWDNSELRIRAAWEDRRKREQGRSAQAPALLALLGGFAGADLDDFEIALFGRNVRVGSKPDGVMAVDPNPPWAGVLAFPSVSPAGAADPVLFIAPAYKGRLRGAVMRLEVRRLGDTLLEITPALDTDVMAAARWADPG